MLRFDAVQSIFVSVFDSFGNFVARRAVSCILLPILVCVLICVRVLFPIQLTPDYVDEYLPKQGPAADELRNLQRYFAVDESSQMYALRRYEYDRVGYIIVRGKNGSSVIELLTLVDILKLWKAIIDIPIYDYGETTTYNGLCVSIPYINECVASPLLGLTVYRLADVFNLSYPIHHVQGFGDIFVGNIIGGITWYPNDTRHIIYKADALLLPYMLKHGTPKLRSLARQWELKLAQFLETVNSSSIELAWYTSETIEANVTSQAGVIGLVIAAIVIAAAIVAILSSFSSDVIRSQPFAAACAVLLACAALAVGILLVILCGMPYSSMGKLGPYTAFAVSMQNFFLLQRSWCRSRLLPTTKERMRFMYRESFVGVLAVSVIDLAGFVSLTFNSIPEVKSFGVYGSVCIVTVFLYHLVLMGGIMTLCGRREQAKKHFFSCDPVIVDEDIQQQEQQKSSVSMQKLKKLVNFENRPAGDSQAEMTTGNLATRFFSGPYVAALMSPITRVLVLLSFIAYVGIAAWGCYRMPSGFVQANAVSRSSYAQNSFRLMDQYFTTYCDYVHVWFDNLQQYPLSVELMQKLGNELSRFENTKFTASAENWLEQLDEFAANSSQSLLNASSLSTDEMKTLFKRYLVNPKSQNFRNDFVFTETGDMAAARFAVRLANCSYDNYSVMTNYLRGIASSSNLSAHVYHYFFNIADMNASVLSGVLQPAIVIAVVALIVSLLFIPVPLCSILLVLCFVATDLGVVGFLSFWGIHFEFSSILTLVLAVGFSINFSFHVAYHFSKEFSAGARPRLEVALSATATPVLLSALVGLLCTACVAVMDNYAGEVIAKALFLGTLFPVYLSLVVLPCALVTLIPDCFLLKRDSTTTAASPRSRFTLS